MIRILKPAQAPAILRNPNSSGKMTATRICELYDASPEEYRSGNRKFKFKSNIYRDKSVKKVLIKAQHGKCCFCEAKVPHVTYGDVEHFRSKGEYRQSDNGLISRPGYYWLAYEWSNLYYACQICNQRHKRTLFPLWSNLYYACQICNQRHKRTLFPLKRPSRRAQSHHDTIADEEPLLIDPGQVDPNRYLKFKEEMVLPRNRSRLGKETIKIAGLNREELLERRRDLLQKLVLLMELYNWLSSRAENTGHGGTPLTDDERANLDKLKAAIERAVLDSAEFAAMARAALM